MCLQMELNIQNIFQEIQLNTSSHPKCLSELDNIYKTTKVDEFTDEFLKCLYIAFETNYKTTNKYIERIFEFCVNFIISAKPISKNEQFLQRILRIIIKYHNDDSANVRYRLCEFINKLLWKVEEEFDSELTDSIIDAMLIRFCDTKSVISVQAATVLYHFQNPIDENCQITKEFVKNIVNVNKNIRYAVVTNMDISVHTLSYFVERCRDIDDKVRLAAFKKFVNVPVKMFQIIQRQNILKYGLMDSSKTVKNYVTESLLPKWLEYFDNDCLKLMKAIQLDSDEKEIEDTIVITNMMLKALFSIKTASEIYSVLTLSDKVIPISEINWEKAMFWDVIITRLRSNEDTEDYLCILPETVSFCNYIGKYCTSSNVTKDKFWELQHYHLVLFHLVNIATNCDISDEASRRNVKDLFTKILSESNVPINIVKKMISYFEILIPNTHQRIEYICDLLSNIRSSSVSKYSNEELRNFEVELAELRVKLNCLMEDLDKNIVKQDFLNANNIKENIKQIKNSMEELNHKKNDSHEIVERNDIESINRFLDVAISMLESPTVTKLNPSLTSLKEQICQTMLLATDIDTRGKIFKSFALLGCIDKNSAEQAVQMFCSPLLAYRNRDSYELPTILVSIAAIVDFILQFGPSILPLDDDVESESVDGLEKLFRTFATLQDVIEIFTQMMDDEIYEIREMSSDGLLKLYTLNKIQSPALLTRFIIKWFSPATDVKIQQMLTYFVEDIPNLQDASSQLEEIFIPVLTTIRSAPDTSPLAAIPVFNVAKFLVQITTTKIHKDCDVHQNIAFRLCSELLKNNDIKCNLIFARVLLMLDIDFDNETAVNELLNLAEEIKDDCTNKATLKYIVKFIENLKAGSTEMNITEE